MTAVLRPRATRWPAHVTVLLLLCAATFISYIDRSNISVAAIAMQAQFHWNETHKGLVLSAFFVGYILMMAASGALAQRYGGRLVLGLAVIWWSLCTILTPAAALTSLSALVMARILLGVGEAAVFPASINLIGRWVPELQRSRAVAMLASSLYLGTVFSLPVTGWLVRDYGWPMPFYAFGLIGLVWAMIWFTGITSERQLQAPASPGASVIPWARLLRLPSVWAIVVAHFCHNWTLYLLLAWLPSYFKSTFGVSIVNAGLLSAAPWLTGFLACNLAGFVADRLLHGGRHATFVRKLMMVIGFGGVALATVKIPGAATVSAGVLLTCCAAGALSVSNAGFATNCFDIAPRHSGVIWGISNTAATLPGIFGVYVTGWLVDRTGSYALPFFVTGVLAMFGLVFYLLFGSGERQVE